LPFLILHPSSFILARSSLFLAAVALALLPVVSQAQTQSGPELGLDSLSAQPPIQSPTIVTPTVPAATDKIFYQAPVQERQTVVQQVPPAPLERNEFQEFVLKSIGRDLPMFGYNLFEGGPSTFAPLDRVPVPSDYVIGPGDEIVIRAWGQIDVDVRATVDRNGRIYIPKVGAIGVAATRSQDLDARVRSAVSRVFKNFDLVVTLGELRSIQIFVVGQVRKPGSYTVSSLATLVNALLASGGPTTKGSMRKVQLKRADQIVTEFDLYDLLQKGDKSKDAQLLPGDVIFVPPIGPLAAISGSINVPAIFELKGGQKLEDLVAMAGGLSTSAAGQKVTLERIFERKNRVVEELPMDASGMARALSDGDIVNVFALSPRLINAVTLRGNVATPMRFEWKEGMRVSDIIPERSMLVVPNYWLQRNRAGRPQSWILESTEAGGDSDAKAGREVKRPGAEVNWDYAVIERLNPFDLTVMLVPFHLGRAIENKASENDIRLEPGDIVTIFSKDDVQGPEAKHSKFVRLEGEFEYAGQYQVAPGETLRKLVARVGGVTADAYIYGAEFTRVSTQAQQQKKLDETLDRLEAEAARAATKRSQSVISKEDAESLAPQAEAQRILIAKLRQIKATGRIVLELPRARAVLNDIPDLVMEDGDRLYIPSRPSTVGVFGAVYNQNAFLYKDGKRIGDYLGQAGGPTRDADKGSLYLLKADGSVVSKQQRGRFFNSFDGQVVVPGDTIVVPEELKVSWTKEFKDWTQIFYQFALGVAGLKVLKDL
jgi:protein involved in polysaccharide export with SLBB domain